MSILEKVNSVSGDLSKHIGRYQGLLNFDSSKWDGNKGYFSERRLQRKAWIFSGLITEDFTVGFAIVDAGLIATAFAYVYERKTGLFIEEKMDKILGFSDEFQPSLQDAWRLDKGNQVWEFMPVKGGYSILYSGNKISLKYVLLDNENGMSTIAPAKDRPFHTTYKNMNLPAEVKIKIGNQEHSWTSDCGTIDFSKGYPGRETFWNWASFSGKAESGESFALNLVAGFNDGLENNAWISGEILPLDIAKFSYKKPISLNECEIVTMDGLSEFRFYPEGKRSEDINLVLFQSRFVQAYGRFEGKILYNGKTLKLQGYGLVEEHYAVW